MLAGALSKARLHGLVTNRDLLVNVLRDERFLDGRVSTDFFERTSVVEASAPMAPDPHLLFAAAVALAETDRLGRRVQAGVPVGWRNVVSQPHRTVLATGDGEEHTVEWRGTRAGYAGTDPAVRVLSASPSEVVLEIDRISARFAVSAVGDAVAVDGPPGRCSCASCHASSTPPTGSRAARCWRRCPGPSSASTSSPGSTSPQDSPSSSSRR